MTKEKVRELTAEEKLALSDSIARVKDAAKLLKDAADYLAKFKHPETERLQKSLAKRAAQTQKFFDKRDPAKARKNKLDQLKKRIKKLEEALKAEQGQ
jgi:hypothetical protein